MHGRIRGLIAGTLRAISLLLATATVAAWIVSWRHPWRYDLEFATMGPRGGELPGSEWGWYILGDSRMIDISPRYSFFEWKLVWWRLMLLWLCYPMWRYLPWRKLGLANDGDTSKFRWLLFKPLPRLVLRRQDLRNLLISHCKTSYIIMAITCVLVSAMITFDRPYDWEAWLLLAGYFALAPLTVLWQISSAFMTYDPDAIGFMTCLLYLIGISIVYLRRTNLIIKCQILDVAHVRLIGRTKKEPPPQPSP